MKKLIEKFHNSTKRFFNLLAWIALAYGISGLIFGATPSIKGRIFGNGLTIACILWIIDYFINKGKTKKKEKNVTSIDKVILYAILGIIILGFLGFIIELIYRSLF